MIPKIGVKRKLYLLEKFEYNPKIIYDLKICDLLKIHGIGEKYANIISNIKIRNQLDNHVKYMNQYKIDLITINEKEYPKILKEIYDPPICLYIKGNKEVLNENNLAIIGCRQASNYGENAARFFSYQLSKKGFNIVSGLARGIDSYAHLGNLRALSESTKKSKKEILKYGKTIAVVGNGLDRVYPSENTLLEKRIINSGGAVISEYPLGTKPEKENFPARNRIISGLSKGVLVVEASFKSGTLITVDCALEQGRDVYAIPGNFNSINSLGTNNLIKQGAKLVTSVDDIETF